MAEYTCRQAADIGRSLGFPGYSKELHSAAKNPDKYGVMWVPELAAVFGGTSPPRERKSEKRIKCHGWRVRLSPEAHSLLNARMKRLGYSTRQAYLENLLRLELREERKFRMAMEELDGQVLHRR